MKRKKFGGIGRLIRDPRNLFYVISAAGILLYCLLSIRYGGALYAWVVQENKPEIRFIDYFSHLGLAENPSRLYQQVSWDAEGSYAAVFPPLAYCVYYMLYRLTAIAGGRPEGISVEEMPGALSVFTIYLIFNAVIFFLAIEITGRRDRKKDLLIFTLLMLSAVFGWSMVLLARFSYTTGTLFRDSLRMIAVAPLQTLGLMLAVLWPFLLLRFSAAAALYVLPLSVFFGGGASSLFAAWCVRENIRGIELGVGYDRTRREDGEEKVST